VSKNLLYGVGEPDYVKFMEVKIDNVNMNEISRKIKGNVKKKENITNYICLTDVEIVIKATEDKDLLKAINHSLLSVPDGMPLVWYARILGCKRIERVSGMELLKKLLEEQNGFRHYLLGDTEQTIEDVVEKARKHNKSLGINGHSPPFKDEFDELDNEEIFQKINKENPDIVWVSFGGGKQEKWMYKNHRKLEKGLMIAVGAAFRFYIGKLKVPPKIFQNIGLQWFFRLMQNPISTGKRQMVTFPEFIVNFPREIIGNRKNLR